MKSPFRRARHVARRVVDRARGRGKPAVVSQRNLGRFRREVARRPRVDLPAQAPTSVAVVVPVFMHAAFLPEMLESVVKQTRLPDELILIDDESPDDSRAIIRDFLAANSRSGGSVSLIVNARNTGQSACLNRAIETASSDLIMILNDDDYLMHDAVATMLDLFGQYRDLALIGAHSIHFSGSRELATAPKLISEYPEPFLPLTVQRPEQVPGYVGYNDLNMTHSGSTFFKVAWQAVGGYRARRDRCVPSSDRDFQLRVNALWPVGIAYKTPFSFWRNDSSVDAERKS